MKNNAKNALVLVVTIEPLCDNAKKKLDYLDATMPLPLEPLVVRTLTLEPKKLMASLQVAENGLKRYMTQARAITHLATQWVEQAYGIRAEDDGETLRLPHPVLQLNATIRTFNRGRIQFSRSIRTGGHRDPLSTRSDMLADTERLDYFFVVDIRRFPQVDIYPIWAAKILNFIHGQDVGKNGITPEQFDRFIRQNFEVEFVDYDHKDFLRRERRLKRLGRDDFPTVTQMRR